MPIFIELFLSSPKRVCFLKYKKITVLITREKSLQEFFTGMKKGGNFVCTFGQLPHERNACYDFFMCVYKLNMVLKQSHLMLYKIE